jgi:radical SAM protein with 4Fe4S-binding SPASM domain
MELQTRTLLSSGRVSADARQIEIGGTTLLVNPRNGSWLRLSERGARAVRRLAEPAQTDVVAEPGGQAADDAETLLPILARGGFLAPSEPASAAAAPAAGTACRDLRNVLLNLTHRCNLRCSHCAVYAAQPAGRPAVHLAAASRRLNGEAEPRGIGEASTAELRTLIDRLADRGARRLVFFGGEPLVRRDFPALLAHAAERIPSLGLTTNGTLLSPAMCAVLSRFGVEVRVSLDGSCAEVNDRLRGAGSFVRTMAGLENLKSAGFERVVLKSVVTRWNVDDVPRLVKLSRRLGATLDLSPFVALGRGASDRHELLPTPEALVRMYLRVWRLAEYFEVPSVSFNAFANRFMARPGEGCGAGCDYVLVDWSGDVFPCEGLQDWSFRLGNVAADDAFRPPPAELFSVGNSTHCGSCPVRYFCRGACAAERIVPGGAGVPSICGFYRQVLPRIASVFDPRASSWQNLQAAFPGEVGPDLLRPYLDERSKRRARRPELRFAPTTRVVSGKRQSLVLDTASRRWLRISTAGLAAVRRRLKGEPAVDGPEPLAVEKAVDLLVEHGFLRRTAQPSTPPQQPGPAARSLHLHVTQNCNLSCETCFVADFLRRGPDRMTLADIERLFDAAVPAGFKNVTITGGEPFLRPDLFDILAAARRRFRLVAVTTNGTALTERSVRPLAGLVDWINVSIDGATAGVHDGIRGAGAFERTLRGLRTLAAAGFPMQRVSLNPTVTKLNHRGLEDVLDIAERFGAGVAFGFFMPTGRGLCNRDRLTLGGRDMADLCERSAERRKKRLGIGPGEEREMTFPRVRTNCSIDSIVAVQADGSVFPCPNLNQPEHRLGNILEADDGTLAELLAAGCKAKQVYRDHVVDDVPGCRRCDARFFCGGGCMANAYMATGDLRGRDPYCAFYRLMWRRHGPLRSEYSAAAAEVTQ